MRKQSTGITPREVEILHLIGVGLTNKEVAARLGISERTVGTHLERLFARLKVHSRAQALTWYQRAADPNAIEALVTLVTSGELDSDLPFLYNTIGERLHAIEAARIYQLPGRPQHR